MVAGVITGSESLGLGYSDVGAAYSTELKAGVSCLMVKHSRRLAMSAA